MTRSGGLIIGAKNPKPFERVLIPEGIGYWTGTAWRTLSDPEGKTFFMPEPPQYWEPIPERGAAEELRGLRIEVEGLRLEVELLRDENESLKRGSYEKVSDR